MTEEAARRPEPRPDDRSSRRSKEIGLDDAAALIRSGDHLATGGIWNHNCPSALVRAIARSGVTDLTISASPATGYGVDVLIAAGCVSRALVPNVTFEHLGLAPAFRRAVQSGDITLIECDEPTLIAGYRAAAAGLPAQIITSIAGTALDEARTDLEHRRQDDREVIEVPAFGPDVVVLHAARADRFGNLQQRGAVFADRLLAKAAGRAVVATVDELVDNLVVREDPRATTIPGYLVSHVVAVPFAAHPCSSHGVYAADERALAEYVRAIASPNLEVREDYWQRTVAVSHDDYLTTHADLERVATASA